MTEMMEIQSPSKIGERRRKGPLGGMSMVAMVGAMTESNWKHYR